jgi:hypothetical protein
MQSKVTIFAKVISGELHLPVYAAKRLKDLKDCYCQIEIFFGKKRTLPQNRYLHGVLIPEFKLAACSAGYILDSDATAKAVMKQMFLKDYIRKEGGDEAIETVRDTSDLNTTELNKLYDDVISFCQDMWNYRIPYPNEVLKLNL